jgi:hypothetical protein
MKEILNIYTSGIFITLVLWILNFIPTKQDSFIDAVAFAILWPLHLAKLAIKKLKDE